MYKPGFLALILKVASSWQVITTTIILVFYFMLVFYVGRLDRGPKRPAKSKTKKPKAVPETEIIEEADTGDLGLEE